MLLDTQKAGLLVRRYVFGDNTEPVEQHQFPCEFPSGRTYYWHGHSPFATYTGNSPKIAIHAARGRDSYFKFKPLGETSVVLSYKLYTTSFNNYRSRAAHGPFGPPCTQNYLLHPSPQKAFSTHPKDTKPGQERLPNRGRQTHRWA